MKNFVCYGFCSRVMKIENLKSFMLKKPRSTRENRNIGKVGTLWPGMMTENLVNCLKKLRRLFVPVFLKFLFSGCSERMVRHWISGSPAPIMAENCRAKLVMSSACTPVPKEKEKPLDLRFTFVTMIPRDRRYLNTSSRLWALYSPFTSLPPRALPS